MENEKRSRAELIGIVVACIFINFLGKWLADEVQLPIWFDMVGTCFATWVCGIWPGIIVGVTNNLLYGFLDSSSVSYAIISVMLSYMIYVCRKRKLLENFSMVMVFSYWYGVAAMVLSTPLNLWIYGGKCGNYWGDALYDMLLWKGYSPYICSIAGSAVIEILDKQITMLVAFMLVRAYWRIKNKREAAKKTMAALAVIVLAATTMFGEVQLASAEAIPYVGMVYDNNNGMLYSEANAVVQTPDGFIWVGSYSGLSKYDGRKFEFMKDCGASNIKTMFVDARGRLWIGTSSDGVIRYENGVFTTISGLPGDYVTCMAESSNGDVYVVCDNQIVKITSEDKVEPLPGDFSDITQMAYYNGRLYFTDKKGGLAILEDEMKWIVPETDDTFTTVVTVGENVIACESNGEIYYITKRGDTYRLEYQFATNVADISDVAQGLDGKLWVCGEKQCGFIENRRFVWVQKDGFDGSFEDICVDYQGNVWLASSRYGLLKYAVSDFYEVFDEASIPAATANAVTNYKGMLYCATDSGLYIIDRKNGNRLVENDISEMLKDVRVRCLYRDSSNNLWIGTYSNEGLICYSQYGKRMRYTAEKSGTTNNRFRCLTEMKDGTIVAGTSDGINFIRDGKVVKTLGKEDGLENSQILCVYSMDNNTVLAGSDGAGIYVICNGEIVGNISKADGLYSNIVMRIVPVNGAYLVVTGTGICKITPGASGSLLGGTVEKLDNFPYYNNYDILVLEDEVYVLSSAGIYVSTVENILNNGEEYRLISNGQGFTASLTANAWNYVDEDSVLYLCGTNGIISFDTKKTSNYEEYQFGITEIVGDGVKYYEGTGGFVIPEQVRDLLIQGSVRNYTTKSVPVRVFVEGYQNQEDSAPVGFEEMEPLSLYNLPGGNYKIHFQIFDESGRKVIAEKVYVLKKESKVWEQSIYRAYLMLVLLDLTFFTSWTLIMTVEYYRRKRRQEAESQERERMLAEEVDKKTEEVQKSRNELRILLEQTIGALGSAVDAKDRYTSGHSRRVGKYSRMIAARAGKSEAEQEEIYYAGLLHDVGKIRVPDGIINKEGRLTDEEFDYIRIHPVAGYHILKKISQNIKLAEGARFHHERYDGHGYPNGLSGENIPEIARIIGVADAYDAMASDRSYRKALPQERVRSEIEKGKGTQFDPFFAELMLEIMDEDDQYLLRQEEMSQKSILVVDDEPMNHKMVQFILKSENQYRVQAVSTGMEAIEVLKENPVDLILLDIEMPGMNGFETLAEIRKLSEIPVVFMTADKDLSTIERAEKMGVDDYLTKPFLPVALKEVVHSILG